MSTMYAILVMVSCLLVATQGQDYRLTDSKNAKILQEARYLQGGVHGSAYVQDDGTEFKEETDADGTRKGSYSYIDDTGKKITVQYTAGKLGFMVSGDHLPKAPEPLPVAPQQQYQPQQPKPYNPIPQQYNTIPQNTQFAYNNAHLDSGSQFQSNIYHNDQGNSQRFGESFPGQFQHPTPMKSHPVYHAPGKLNLNRTPDGFQYSFSSN